MKVNDMFNLVSNLYVRLILSILVLAVSIGCEDEQAMQTVDSSSSEEEPTIPQEVQQTGPWADYERSITPPTPEQNERLISSPYIYPTQDCRLASELENLPESTVLTTKEDGQEYVCVWNNPTASAPEGVPFNEVGSCEHVFTQAPSWFVRPRRVYESDSSLLENEDFVRELKWAQSQIESSGCACCHSSAIGTDHVTGFDFNAPEVWTDTLNNSRLYLLSGTITQHQDFGFYDSEETHGFSREITMIPSTDPMRLRAFFLSEFERRNGSEEDITKAYNAIDSLFGQQAEESEECAPDEGIIDGKITWNEDKEARQIYIQEITSKLPGFPPNLDRPEGTVWAYQLPSVQDVGFKSGEISLDSLPEEAIQLVPKDSSIPQLEVGKTYRLFVRPDVMLNRILNCTFTYE